MATQSIMICLWALRRLDVSKESAASFFTVKGLHALKHIQSKNR
jgi:hypothetical protein